MSYQQPGCARMYHAVQGYDNVYLYGNFIVFSMRLWLDPKVHTFPNSCIFSPSSADAGMVMIMLALLCFTRTCCSPIDTVQVQDFITLCLSSGGMDRHRYAPDPAIHPRSCLNALAPIHNITCDPS